MSAGTDPATRARELAQAQASDHAIMAALQRDCGLTRAQATDWFAQHTELVNTERHAARADLAERVWRAGKGEEVLEQGQIAMLRSLAYQYLGWTPNGVDHEVRKHYEKAERNTTAKRGLRAV